MSSWTHCRTSNFDRWALDEMGDLFPVEKTEGILVFLRALSEREGNWQVMDHWQGDLAAVGVIWAGRPERLAYISSWEQSVECYFVELEKDSEDDSFEVVERVERCDL